MSVARNIRLYIRYIALTRAYFWYAVFFLYFQSKFTTADVLLLEAIYYVSVVCVEVPSGYFSDKLGRTNALRISAVSLATAYFTFAFADSFIAFAVAQVLFATGFAFASGSDTSLLFGSLKQLGREDEFAEFESKVASSGSFATAIAAIAGGVLGVYALSYGHLASAVCACLTIAITFAFREPEHDDPSALRFSKNLRDVFGLVRRPDLAWFFFSVVTLLVLVHIPYEYYQPYIGRLELFSAASTSIEPTIVTGIHAAVALLFASFVARKSSSIAKKTGVVVAVIFALATLVALIALMAAFDAWWVAVLLVARSAPSAFVTPIVNAAVVPRVPDAIRATYLSVQSLAGRLAFAATLAVLSYVAETTDQLSPMLWLGAAIGGCALFGLIVTAKFAHRARA